MLFTDYTPAMGNHTHINKSSNIFQFHTLKLDITLYSVDSDKEENVFASKTLFLTGREVCSFWVPLTGIGLAVENLCINILSVMLQI